MTVFSAAAGRDLAIIAAASLVMAILVNLGPIFALVRMWVES